LDLDDAYDEGVREAQAFIDRHPNGYPAMVMGQDADLTEPEDELERERARGWYERLGDEIGTEENPNESWKQKMQAFDLWPNWLE
jgi:hypothetical protein